MLDIGAGSGVMGSELKLLGFGEISAVEIDERARNHIHSKYKKVTASLSEYQGQKFDLILLLDVLEHTSDPHGFLKEISSLLAPGGTLLISVPNIAHWSIRFSLLFGFFHYTERGILDKTHLQFFTRSRFHRVIALSGLSIEKSSASIEPIEFLLPPTLWKNSIFAALSKARKAFAEFLPGLMAYQHLAVVKNKE